MKKLKVNRAKISFFILLKIWTLKEILQLNRYRKGLIRKVTPLMLLTNKILQFYFLKCCQS